jgi:hypothetical protein
MSLLCTRIGTRWQTLSENGSGTLEKDVDKKWLPLICAIAEAGYEGTHDHANRRSEQAR